MGFVEHIAYMIQALAVRDGTLFDVIVLFHVDCPFPGNRKIFFPKNRYAVHTPISAPFADISYPFLGTITVCLDGNC